MKHSLLIAVVVAGLLTGCSTSNISTQTPDDLYYSPSQGSPGSIATQKQQDSYERYMSSNDDQYLSMKVHNYALWSPLDDYSYWYDSRYNFYNSYYNYSGYLNNWYTSPYYYYAFNPYYNNYYMGGYNGWAGWHNPSYIVASYKNTRVPARAYTSGSNITAYQNRNYNNTNTNFTYINPKGYQSGNTNNGATTNSFGNIVRRVFSSPASSSSASPNNSSSRNSNSSTYSTPVRVYTPAPAASTPAPSSSSSAGGSSGGYNSSGSSSSGGRSPRN